MYKVSLSVQWRHCPHVTDSLLRHLETNKRHDVQRQCYPICEFELICHCTPLKKLQNNAAIVTQHNFVFTTAQIVQQFSKQFVKKLSQFQLWCYIVWAIMWHCKSHTICFIICLLGEKPSLWCQQAECFSAHRLPHACEAITSYPLSSWQMYCLPKIDCILSENNTKRRLNQPCHHPLLLPYHS